MLRDDQIEQRERERAPDRGGDARALHRQRPDPHDRQVGLGPILIGAADRDREAAQHQQQRDRHHGRVIVAPLHRARMHRLDQDRLEQIADQEGAGGRDEDREPPEIPPERIGDDHILDVAAQHVELAHRPVDHPDDAVDEGDAERHQRVQHADHHAGDERLDQELGAVHPSQPRAAHRSAMPSARGATRVTSLSLSERIGDLGIGLRLVRLGVFQDHQRRRPVVPQRAFGLRERHRHRRPALERAGLERLDQRLRLGGLGHLDRLREHERVARSALSAE